MRVHNLCGACRLGLVTHNYLDPQCIARAQLLEDFAAATTDPSRAIGLVENPADTIGYVIVSQEDEILSVAFTSEHLAEMKRREATGEMMTRIVKLVEIT